MHVLKKRHAVALGLILAALGTPPGVRGQEPELVGTGVVSTEDRHETFPAVDPVDGSLWFSVYTDNFDQQTIMRAEPAEDGWSTPEAAPFSGHWGDRAPRFSPDGARLYFTSNRPLPGTETPGRFHIWQVERQPDQSWSPPSVTLTADPDADDIHSSVVASGAIYVASTRPGAAGPYDLFRHSSDGSIAHVPSPLNDEHPLTDVWVSDDERWMIVVITDHPNGMGGDDLYVSRSEDGEWRAARNIGTPINSEEFEYGPNVSPDGRFLYFTSHRRGTADIFRIPIGAIDRDVSR